MTTFSFLLTKALHLFCLPYLKMEINLFIIKDHSNKTKRSLKLLSSTIYGKQAFCVSWDVQNNGLLLQASGYIHTWHHKLTICQIQV